MTLLNDTPADAALTAWLPSFDCTTSEHDNSPRSLADAPLGATLRPTKKPIPPIVPTPPPTITSTTTPPAPSAMPPPVSPTTLHRPRHDTHSCPTLPLPPRPPPPRVDPLPDEQPAPFRRGSLPLARLAPLDFRNLRSACPVTAELHTARRRIEHISTSLSRFRPYLFVGGDAAATDLHNLRRNNITHIVNLAGNTTPNYHHRCPHFKYLRLYPRDDPTEALDDLFADIAAFVDEARRSRTACVIHCRQGVSRSVTAALAYVITREGLNSDVAMRDMLICRPIAAPNHGFMRILADLYLRMRQGRKRPRLSIVAPHAASVAADPDALAVYVTRPVVPLDIARGSLDARQVYVLERADRNGFAVLRGSMVSDELWGHAQRLAQRLGEQLERNLNFFAPEPSTQATMPYVDLCEQGDRLDIEAEMLAAMKVADDCSL